MTGVDIQSPQDIRENMEAFKIYMRGHNLYDIFYGRYKDVYKRQAAYRPAAWVSEAR